MRRFVCTSEDIKNRGSIGCVTPFHRRQGKAEYNRSHNDIHSTDHRECCVKDCSLNDLYSITIIVVADCTHRGAPVPKYFQPRSNGCVTSQHSFHFPQCAVSRQAATDQNNGHCSYIEHRSHMNLSTGPHLWHSFGRRAAAHHQSRSKKWTLFIHRIQ